MKKCIAFLAAALCGLSALVTPAFAEEREPVTDLGTMKKIVDVMIAEIGPARRYAYSGIQYNYDPYETEKTLIIFSIKDECANLDLVQTETLSQYLQKHNVFVRVATVSSAIGIFPREAIPRPVEYTLGDITDEGGVQIDDALAALRGYASGAASGETGLTEAQGYAADVDGNGEVSLDDAQHILRYYTLNTLGQRNVGWVDIVVFGA